MKKRIESALASFEWVKRGEKDIVVLKDDAPEELRESVHAAHGDKMPNDWVYATYHGILASMDGYEMTKADDMEESRHEIVDSLVDLYTHQLTWWLHDYPDGMQYLEEAADGFVRDDCAWQLLARAQYLAIDEIYGHVMSYVANE